jgi:hypothetical protein
VRDLSCRGEAALPGSRRCGPWGRVTTHRCSGAGDAEPRSHDASDTARSGPGNRGSGDEERPLHFGFGHADRLHGELRRDPRTIRGAARASEGRLDIFNLVRSVSRVLVNMPNPRRSASARRRNLFAPARVTRCPPLYERRDATASPFPVTPRPVHGNPIPARSHC